MKKIISAHQPNYLPYLGFFDKVKRSDVFVVLDDVQFSPRDFHNRNRIKTAQGAKWLTIPVDSKERIPINQINNGDKVFGMDYHWCDYHYRLISDNYKKAPFFSQFSGEVKSLYEKAKGEKRLLDSNMIFIRYFMEKFGITTPIVLSSDMHIQTTKNERLIDICKNVSGDVYLSGDGAKDYLDKNLFSAAGIEAVFQEYHHPAYSQINGEFLPFMCSFDYLFNCGTELPASDSGR